MNVDTPSDDESIDPLFIQFSILPLLISPTIPPNMSSAFMIFILLMQLDTVPPSSTLAITPWESTLMEYVLDELELESSDTVRFLTIPFVPIVENNPYVQYFQDFGNEIE